METTASDADHVRTATRATTMHANDQNVVHRRREIPRRSDAEGFPFIFIGLWIDFND